MGPRYKFTEGAETPHAISYGYWTFSEFRDGKNRPFKLDIEEQVCTKLDFVVALTLLSCNFLEAAIDTLCASTRTLRKDANAEGRRTRFSHGEHYIHFGIPGRNLNKEGSMSYNTIWHQGR